MIKNLITRSPIKQNTDSFPTIIIHWQLENDQHGYFGRISKLLDKNTKDDKEYFILIRQSSPIGLIIVNFSPNYSPDTAWAYSRFEGVTILERDLQWATIWAIQCIENFEKTYKIIK